MKAFFGGVIISSVFFISFSIFAFISSSKPSEGYALLAIVISNICAGLTSVGLSKSTLPENKDV